MKSMYCCDLQLWFAVVPYIQVNNIQVPLDYKSVFYQNMSENYLMRKQLTQNSRKRFVI